VVVEQIQELAKSRLRSLEANDALAGFLDLSTWDSLPAVEQALLVQRLVQRVEYDGRQGKVAITFHPLDNNPSNGERTPQKENHQ
jgi:hypothetical protein